MQCVLPSLEHFTQAHHLVLNQFSTDGADPAIVTTAISHGVRTNEFHTLLGAVSTTRIRCRKMMSKNSFGQNQQDLIMKSAQLNDLLTNYNLPFLAVLDMEDDYPFAGIGFPTSRVTVIYNVSDNIVTYLNNNEIDSMSLRDFLKKVEKIYYIPHSS